MNEYVLITGASSGVGKELSVALSKKYPLILNGRNMQRLLETKTLCMKENPDLDVKIWQYDLEHIDSLEDDLKKWLQNSNVKVRGFVHCAGIMKLLPCKVFSVDAFEETYKTNVFSAALIVKILAMRKINNKSLNSVVFISSNISNRGAKAFGIYGSSKAALDGLMRNLAMELAPNIRVNSVLPGGMVTEMTSDMFEDEEMKKRFSIAYPLGIGTPTMITPMVEFLISERSNWITGQQFTVDGGRTIDITEKA